MICTWLIINSLSNFIAFKFTFIDLKNDGNCPYDYVEVRDGNGVNSPLLGKFCDRLNSSIVINVKLKVLLDQISHRQQYIQKGSYGLVCLYMFCRY